MVLAALSNRLPGHVLGCFLQCHACCNIKAPRRDKPNISMTAPWTRTASLSQQLPSAWHAAILLAQADLQQPLDGPRQLLKLLVVAADELWPSDEPACAK